MNKNATKIEKTTDIADITSIANMDVNLIIIMVTAIVAVDLMSTQGKLRMQIPVKVDLASTQHRLRIQVLVKDLQLESNDLAKGPIALHRLAHTMTDINLPLPPLNIHEKMWRSRQGDLAVTEVQALHLLQTKEASGGLILRETGDGKSGRRTCLKDLTRPGNRTNKTVSFINARPKVFLERSHQFHRCLDLLTPILINTHHLEYHLGRLHRFQFELGLKMSILQFELGLKMSILVFARRPAVALDRKPDRKPHLKVGLGLKGSIPVVVRRPEVALDKRLDQRSDNRPRLKVGLGLKIPIPVIAGRLEVGLDRKLDRKLQFEVGLGLKTSILVAMCRQVLKNTILVVARPPEVALDKKPQFRVVLELKRSIIVPICRRGLKNTILVVAHHPEALDKKLQSGVVLELKRVPLVTVCHLEVTLDKKHQSGVVLELKRILLVTVCRLEIILDKKIQFRVGLGLKNTILVVARNPEVALERILRWGPPSGYGLSIDPNLTPLDDRTRGQASQTRPLCEKALQHTNLVTKRIFGRQVGVEAAFQAKGAAALFQDGMVPTGRPWYERQGLGPEEAGGGREVQR